MTRKEHNQVLREFVEALRHVLGLDPLVQGPPPPERVRFYREPAPYPTDEQTKSSA